MARQTPPPETDIDFHDEYGDAFLASGATFCVATLDTYSTANWNRMEPVPLGEPPQRDGEISNRPSWCHTESSQNQRIINAT